MKKQVLIITNHRASRSPSQRFRFEQYLNFLERNEFEFTFSNIINERDDKILYSKGNLFFKALIELKSRIIRLKDLRRANQFDLIFIQREALLTSSSWFEKKFSESNAKVIFDFDDAIWLPNVSQKNQALQILKNPAKTNRILEYADMVFAGNKYLSEYAQKLNSNVKIVPTTIDTSYHKRTIDNSKKQITIGWTGTQTTLKYLKLIEPALETLQNKYKSKIKFQIICDQKWESSRVSFEFIKWNKEKEIDQLQNFDIGVMPLIDDEWSKGKCGFKGLQYMSLETPAVLSPVGVNVEIIQHGENGFLAKSDEEWVFVLSQLIENEELRRDIGRKARKTIEDKYSVEANKMKYLNYFNELLDSKQL